MASPEGLTIWAAHNELDFVTHHHFLSLYPVNPCCLLDGILLDPFGD
jgi:hypothetical protein